MRKAALILGITGGLIGLIISLLAGLVSFFASLITGFEILEVKGIILIILAIIGISGGILARAKPVFAGILMLVSCMGGFFILFIFWTFAGILLLMGGILAIAGRKEKR